MGYRGSSNIRSVCISPTEDILTIREDCPENSLAVFRRAVENGYGKAIEWYRKAMELGDSDAEELLKRCKKSIGLGKLVGIFS